MNFIETQLKMQPATSNAAQHDSNQQDAGIMRNVMQALRGLDLEQGRMGLRLLLALPLPLKQRLCWTAWPQQALPQLQTVSASLRRCPRSACLGLPHLLPA